MQNQEAQRDLDHYVGEGGGARVEQEAIASLARGDYVLTYELTEALCSRNGENKSGTADETSLRQVERVIQERCGRQTG